MNATKNSRPFAAKFPSRCSLTGSPIAKGDLVQFVNGRIALVQPPTTGTRTAPRSVAAARVAAPKKDTDGSPGRRPKDARLDGQCRFCRETPVDACPMCGWSVAPVAASPAPAPVAQSKVAVLVDVAADRASLPGDVLRALRTLLAQNDQNSAAALIVGLAGGPTMRDDAAALAAIDANCARRGWISNEEKALRVAMVDRAIASLGYDPRTQDAPAPKPAPVIPEIITPKPLPPVIPEIITPKALPPAPSADGLKGGDWKGLADLVLRGALTEEEARQIGAIWMQVAAAR